MIHYIVSKLGISGTLIIGVILLFGIGVGSRLIYDCYWGTWGKTHDLIYRSDLTIGFYPKTLNNYQSVQLMKGCRHVSFYAVDRDTKRMYLFEVIVTLPGKVEVVNKEPQG